MKLKSKSILSIPIPIYNGVIYFSYNNKIKDIVESIIEAGDTDEMLLKILETPAEYEVSKFGGLTITYDSLVIISVAEQKTLVSYHNTVAHEVLHAVSHFMKYKGLKFTSSSEEAYAYLVGYLTEKIYELGK